ncbi:MAG: N-acetylglucosamine-6-phosphate deacetylase [Frankiales bacterium]|nr:N-acetylglucosamine-6-phosphate deacetylase [Frankiales bacterium]MDX6212567.1 N-acetylglucosamine-6-phosphate deacetylase [Frankiales bacterium]
MPIISAPRMLVEGQLSGPASLVVEGGTIVDVVEGMADGDCLRLEHGLLTPGLIDLQINGYYGVDFVDASTDEWVAVASRLPETGVTAFQPTFITAPVERLLVGMRHASAALPTLTATPGAARVLGVHLEGPFLSPRQAGVHDISFMHAATTEDLDALLAPGVVDGISMVTLAPELPGALDVIRRLRTHGVVVSIGHSDARGAEVEAAVEAGARMVTHIFNAQRGLGHREPGVAGQALADPRLTVGLIADLHHVAPEICTVVMQAARGRVALVTDAVAAAGMPPGSYELGGQQIRISPGEGLARRTDGTIAGSSLSLDAAIRNLVDVGIAASDVLDAATRVPADVLGRTDLGRLATGAKADLVWWSDDLRPLRVWVGGQVAYDATSVPA